MRGESLYEWCEKNKEYGKMLLTEFGEGNNSQAYFDPESHTTKTPSDYSQGTHKKIKWTCSKCGTPFIQSPNVRTCPSGRSGCPYCAGNQLVKGKNDLYTWCLQNGSRGEQLLQEFGDGNNTQQYFDPESHTTKTPKDYSRGTHKKIKWTCRSGHIWIATIKNRVLSHANCPYCNPVNMTVDGKNDLYTWCTQNGNYGKMLLQELDPKQNAHEIAKKSSKKVLWKCSKGHEWEAAPADRTSRMSYCPRCTGHSTSYPEQFLYRAIKQLYPNTQNRYIAFSSEQNPRGTEYDIAITQPLCGHEAVYIEYSPTGWHRGKEEIDEFKRKQCESNNIGFLSIIEDSYNEYKENWEAPNIVAHLKHGQIDDYIVRVLKSVLEYLDRSITEVDIEKARKEAKRATIGIVDWENSFEYHYPDLSKEWDESNVYLPKEVTWGSNKRILWKCPNCKHQWYAPIYTRTKGTGCPQCHYNWKEKKIKREKNFVSMATKYPHLLKEIDLDKNKELDLNEIGSADDKAKAWWICKDCGTSYYQFVRSRAKGYCGCPKCKYKSRKK